MKRAKRIDAHRSAWWLCALLAGSAPLHAQAAAGSQPGDVPREFAEVLLMHGGSGDFRIGRMPENLPAAAELAAGARVIGSVIWRDRSESAIAVRDPVTEARLPFEARLRAAGWTARPASDQPERGFLPPYTEDRGFCWAETDAQLSVTVRAAPGGGSYIRLNYFAPGQGRHCAAPLPPARATGTALESLMPSLRTPDGAQAVRGGGGGGGNEYETRTTITSSYTAAQLISHFEPQLREQGWSITEQLSGDTTAIVTAHRNRESGADLLLLVSALRVDAEQVALSMRIVVRSASR